MQKSLHVTSLTYNHGNHNKINKIWRLTTLYYFPVFNLVTQKYYILVNVRNKYESEFTLLSTLKGSYSSLKVRGKESFGLTIQTFNNRRVTFKAIKADGSPAFINGEKEIHLIPRIAATSFTLNITKHPAGMYGFGFEVVLCM